MGVTGYPFERQDTTETQYQRIMGRYAGPGVVSAPGGAPMSAVDAGGLSVRFTAGLVHLNGMILDNDGADDEQSVVDVGPADATTRVDRIVARFDPIQDRTYLHHLRGTPGSTTPPPLVRTTNGIHDVRLYRVQVNGGAVGFSQGDLIDEREWLDARIGRWTQGNRPSSPGLYDTGHNLTTGRLEFWDGTEWVYLTDSRERLIPGGALAGGTPPADAAFYRQAGYRTVTTQPDGAAIVVFPQPFPEGLLSVQVTLFTGVGVGGTPPATAVIYAPESTSERRPSRSAFHVSVRLPNGSPYPSAMFGIGYDAVGW